MSWYQRRVYEPADFEDGTAVELPANFQINDDVKLWVFDKDGKPTPIPCKVVGVTIKSMHEISYDLAFKIEGVQLWCVVREFRGYVTPADVNECDPDGGLVPADEVEKAIAEFVASETLVERLMGRG